ncbi:hypothetical protein DOTSEDRAFT_73530 [Dothistroma septosporum NZE10]|uniref:Metallo-beta-lactamase domain-containing protein n=1 Tax=Dothistroma septosporum (strain NZE10 / CBS 128990) TaxID=675120 RepID=N1PJM1_DOTSN|nr:hypothetical protein DOTSEDRAFT_73530 [Dothistroma septosporum NZE10]
MSSHNLVELDSVEVLVIIDNELDPISQCPNPAVQQTGSLKDIAIASKPPAESRAGAIREFRMEDICCSAHGLSLMITATQGDQQHTILFDTGPEESAFERNAKRLRADLAKIETIQLSHWHRDHSGGMLRTLRMIDEAKIVAGSLLPPVIVDLHPDRPMYSGIKVPDIPPFSMEADPTFEEIEGVGGKVVKSDQPHTVLSDMFLVSGEIPRVTPYEKGLKFGTRLRSLEKGWEDDSLMKDERLLMCKVKGKGIVMFTGCSHAGVVNASKHAVELGKGTPLYAVMGGYHLADGEPELVQNTVADLKALDVQVLLAGHCTGWRAKFEIQNQMPGRLVPSFVGSKFVL